MFELDIIIIWISTLIWTLFMPFILLLCCKKRQQHSNNNNNQKGGGGPVVKSKRCNKAPGLLNDDPDLKSEDKVLPADGAAQTTDLLILSNKNSKNNNRPSREPTVTVTKDQDTDLRSFLSEKKHKDNNKASKQLSLAPTQDLEAAPPPPPPSKEKAAAKKVVAAGIKPTLVKPTLEGTQMDSSDKRTLQETQKDDTGDMPGGKAEETKDIATNKKAPSARVQDLEGKSPLLGRSVIIGQQPGMTGKSVEAIKKPSVPGNNNKNPLQHPKQPKGMPSAIKPLAPPAAGALPDQSKYMAV